ncbi:MAG: OmpA family protein [Kineosporiaceae bacterium]
MTLFLSGCAVTPPAVGTVRPVCFGGDQAETPRRAPSGNADSATTSGIVVLAATATSAEPRPTVPAGVVAELTALGARDDACAVLIVGSRDNVTITTMPITPRRANGQVERGSHRAAALQANIRAIAAALAQAQSVHPGLDTLGLLHEVAARYAPSTVYLFTSGIQTEAPIDLRSWGWGADPGTITAFVAAERWLPNLSGWRVVGIGLGDAAGSQPRLTPPLHERVTALWTAICRASHARDCQLQTRRTAAAPPLSTNRVPVVALPAPRVTPQQLTIPDSLLFALGSATLTPSADSILADVALRGRRDYLSVVGHTDASTGTVDGNNRLSLDRAHAVAARLVALGVPEDHLQTIGAGSAGFSREDEQHDPGLISAHRCVTITFLPISDSPAPAVVPTPAETR